MDQALSEAVATVKEAFEDTTEVATVKNKSGTVEQEAMAANGFMGIAYGPWQEDPEELVGGISAEGHSDPGTANTEAAALPPAPSVNVKRFLASLNGSTEREPLAPVDFTHLMRADRPKPVPVLTYVDLGEVYVFARQGEIIRVAGEPGVGKSFWLLEITLAMRTGEPVAGTTARPSRVMWIDEEGDEDILAERLALLRATGADLHSDMFRYFLNQDVRLDHPEPRERLFAQVADFAPDVIVIDSATRIASSLDENYAGDMARLFNEGIKPLARVFGATVFLVDHLRKTSDGPLDHRIRGSIEKSAQVDRNWILQKTADDSFTLAHGKTRRGAPPPKLKVRRDVTNGLLRHLTDGLA